jgi:hypothetical protein
MKLYGIVVFIHAAAVLTLAAGLGIETWMLFQLRRTTSLSDAARWIGPIPALTVIGIGSLITVHFTGAWLTDQLGAWALAWPKLAVVGIVLVLVFGALTGRRLRAIRRICIEGKTSDSNLTARLPDRFLKLSLSIRIWVVLGTLLLMVARPGLQGSMAIISASVALGLISVLLKFRPGKAVRRASPPVTPARDSIEAVRQQNQPEPPY